MSTRVPKNPDGKPTIEPDNHDQNIGQRERSHAVGRTGKPTISQETHEANYGQRDPIDEEEDLDVEETRGTRQTGEDIEESRGPRRTDTDIEGSRGERAHGDDTEPYIGETGVLSDDRDVE